MPPSQSWNHLWGLFVFQFTCADSRCSNWTENYYVFEWPTLQVNVVMVITYRMLTKMLKLRHVAGYCSACFLSSGYIAVFIVPSTWSFYLTSVLIGIAAAGKFLSHQLSWNIRYQIFFTIMLKRPLGVFKIHVCTSMQNIVRAVVMLRHPHRDLRIAISQYAGKLQSFKNLLWFWSFVYFQLLSPTDTDLKPGL